jgi:photosystem II stability/assembly factor-like uncharacterized protein
MFQPSEAVSGPACGGRIAPRVRVLTPLVIAALVTGAAASLASSWVFQASPATERLRGVSAASDTVAWASGNNGTVVRTVDGGATWTRAAVPGSESLDFRDIEAFGAGTAYVLAIGNGDKSRIYKTEDGGKSWTLQFTNPDARAFYDAIAFWDVNTGIAVGDPVDGRFTILRTGDGGRTWERVPAANIPEALPGDGAFAASGTCLVTLGSRHAWFGTGGAARARVYRSTDQGLTWAVADTPITAGNASSGVFSLAFSDTSHGIAVGGDYRLERETGDNLATTSDGGRTWAFPGTTRLRSFRSAVAFVPGSQGRRLIAVGPGGTDTSADGGRAWAPLGEEGFHALSVSPDGGAAWAVGEGGRIAALRLPR